VIDFDAQDVDEKKHEEAEPKTDKADKGETS
jgi:hypothetical protein